MADFCGEWYGGSTTARADLLGDFLADVEKAEATLEPGYVVQLGICEGHGSGVILARDASGSLWFAHVPLGKRKRKGMPDPIEVPAK